MFWLCFQNRSTLTSDEMYCLLWNVYGDLENFFLKLTTDLFIVKEEKSFYLLVLGLLLCVKNGLQMTVIVNLYSELVLAVFLFSYGVTMHFDGMTVVYVQTLRISMHGVL